jgi:PAS domain S-box-containing protein
MLLPPVIVQAIYVLVVVMGCGLAGLLWKNLDKPGARSLVIVNVGIAWWSAWLFVSTMAGDTLARLSIRFVYIGVVTLVIGIFIFGLEYTGRERYLKRNYLLPLAVYPLFTVFFVFVNPGDLFFTTLDPSGVYVEQGWGPAFVVYTILSYVLVGAFTVFILDLLFRSNRPLYRGQAVALFLATVTPLVSNVVWVLELVAFDTTPLGFTATTALLSVAILRYQLADITPVARDKVVDNIRDGMFVVDTDDRIVDTNPAARALVGMQADDLLGMTIHELFEDFPDMRAAYDDLTADRSGGEETLELGDLYLNVTTTPIDDDRGRHVGWVMLTQDVSEQKRSERELEQQIEKLDQFAGLVSHDLRNPINVARGYIQQTQATGNTEHLEKSEEAMDRMEAIIDDVLALAREGQDVTEPAPTELGAVAERGWDNVDTGGASLDVGEPATDVTILADETRLQRMFENLFRNSIEHGVEDYDSEEYGDEEELPADFATDHTVMVDVVEESGSELSFFIGDDGVGIPTDKYDQVFEDGYTTNRDGTGLGLAIVEQIAHAHGWDVEAGESDAGGARFDITGVGKPMAATKS